MAIAHYKEIDDLMKRYLADFGLSILRDRRLVVWLYPLRRADGEEFAAGTMYEVLRQDGGYLNLCEIDSAYPFRMGRTIVRVSQS